LAFWLRHAKDRRDSAKPEQPHEQAKRIARAPRLPLVIPMPHDPRLRRVCTRLLADPSDTRTLDAWSEIAGASARTLARLFESELQLVRFHNALEAIAREEPIERIAAGNGYRSPSAFSAAFRAVMGHAPTARLS
jgi:AraC-like DNA-binding protein